MSNTNSDVIRGLREAADFLEQHPALPAAKFASVTLRYPHLDSSRRARAALEALAAALGDRAKETRSRGDVEIVGAFAGNVRVKAVALERELATYQPIIPQGGVPVTPAEDEAFREIEARR